MDSKEALLPRNDDSALKEVLVAKVEDSVAPQQKAQFWVLKCLYFLLAGSGAGIGKFLPVFFYNLDKSPSAIALLLTTKSLTSFVSALFWGRLADLTGAFKQIIVATALLSCVLACGFMLDVIQHSEYLLLALVGVFSLFNSCTGSLIDSITILFVKDSGQESYGEQRLWAAVGWGSMTFASGCLVDHTSMDAIFIVFSAAMMLTVIIVVCYFKNPPRGGASGSDDANTETKIQQVSVFVLICKAPVLLLFANLLVTGTLIAFVESFLFVYMADVYNASNTLMGLCVLVMTTFEIPVFKYSGWLIEHVGIVGLLTTAHLLYATRVVCYTLIPKDMSWLFLCLEPSHGLVFAGMWVASVELASRLSPSSSQGTMQACVGSIYYVLGAGVIGTNLAGYIVTSQGGGERGFHALYRFGAVAMVGWSLLWNVMSFVQRRLSSSEGKDKGKGVAIAEVYERLATDEGS